MAYNPAIPMATDRLKDSQGDLMNNFSSIYAWVAQNHTQFDSTQQGRHQFVEFPTGVPTGVTNITTPEVALYSNNGTTSGVPELFFQRNNLGASMGYAITEGLNANPGYSRLPSGLLIKWGTSSSSVMDGNLTYNPGGTPAYTGTPFVCFVTSTYVAGQSATDFDRTLYFVGFNVAGDPANTFRVHKQNGSAVVPFSYLIIGV